MKFTDEIFKEICAEVSEGKSLRSVCRRKDMPSIEAFRLQINKDEARLAQYTCARTERADFIFEECMDIADESENDMKEGQVDQEAIQRAKLRIDTRKWMLGKMQPKKYGDKVDLAVEGTLKLNVMEIVTREEADIDDDGFIST